MILLICGFAVAGWQLDGCVKMDMECVYILLIAIAVFQGGYKLGVMKQQRKSVVEWMQTELRTKSDDK